MWAIVKDNEITETFSNLKGLVINNIQYSRNIFSFRWSEALKEMRLVFIQ